MDGYYLVWYNGEMRSIGIYYGFTYSETLSRSFWDKINPFVQCGYEKGLSLYTDGTLWAIHKVSSTDVMYAFNYERPGMSFKTFVESAEEYGLDLHDGEVAYRPHLDIKKRIREGYSLSWKQVCSDTSCCKIMEYARKYNRRRPFKYMCVIGCTCIVTEDPALFRWTHENDRNLFFYRNYDRLLCKKDLTPKEIRLLYILYDIYLLDIVSGNGTGGRIYDGLYDGLSAALQRL